MPWQIWMSGRMQTISRLMPLTRLMIVLRTTMSYSFCEQ
jgi:hypothetical protein